MLMLSKNVRNIILNTSVALSIVLTSAAIPAYFDEAYSVVEASTTSVMKATANVNMRTGAGTGYAVILTIPQGAQVTLISSANGWSKVTYNGKTGYASNTYLAAVTSTAPTTTSAMKTTANVNMRTGAGTGYAVILTIPQGAQVTMLSSANGWAKVTYNGKTGYASSTYLVAATGTAPAPVAPTTVSVTKTTVNLNMRSGAGSGYGILLTIPSGTEVKVNSTSNGWTNVTYGGKTGYVSSTYLKTTTVSVPVTTPTPTPAPVPAPTETVSVTKTTVNLNMRSGAGTGYGIILTIPSGTEVKVNSASNGWTNVTYGGKTGYVSSTYLKTTTVSAPVVTPTPIPTPTPPPAPVETVSVTKTNANLNMRSGAGTGYGILLTIPSGTEVKVNSTSNGWTNVTYGGKTGYVASQYLTTTVIPVTTPEVPPTVPVVETLPSVLVLEDIKTSYDNVDVKVHGYALSDSGVNSITVTLDGRDIPVTRGQRADLSSLYSNYSNLDNIGFSFGVAKSTLSVGNHTVVVKATSNDGTYKKNTYSFKMTKPAPAISISGVTDGQDVPSGIIAVTGFAVNIDGVASVKYYVNGSVKTDLLYGKASSATGNYSAYTGYKNANFTFSVNSSLLVKPINSIKVELTGIDGTVYERSVILRGAGSANYVAESYVNSLDYYVGLESTKSSLAKGALTSNTIKNYMDPANYIYDDANKYIFMDLSYEEGNYSVTAEDLNKFLVGKGVLADQGAAYLEAANTYKVNPYYLIAHSILETGHGTSTLAKGQYVTDTYTRFGDKSSIVIGGVPLEDRTKLVYNVFGIGAWDSDPNLWGKQKAYTEKWFSVADAIKGGAKWISTNYTNRPNYNQNTLYKMRYNIAEGNNHEYATDLGWAVKQAARIKTQLDAMGIKAESLTFIYPKFK